jgi:hypothetical protein
MNLWIRIRWVLLVASFTMFLFAPTRSEGADSDWTALLIIGLVMPVGLAAVIGVQFLNPRSAPIWEYPSWRSNFLNFRQPIQFFHFAGYVCLTQGIGATVKVLITSAPITPLVLSGFVMAASAAAGVWACTRVYRRKMVARD